MSNALYVGSSLLKNGSPNRTPTAGNDLIIIITGQGTTSPGVLNSVTDSQGQTVLTDFSYTASGYNQGIGVYRIHNATAAAHTITANWGTTPSNGYDVILIEASSVGGLDTGAGTVALATGNSTTPTTGTLTPGSNGDLILGAAIVTPSVTFGSWTTMTLASQDGSGPSTSTGYLDQSTHGAASGSVSVGATARNWTALSIAYSSQAAIPTITNVNGALQTPQGVGVVSSTTGGTIGKSQLRYYVVTAVSGSGESLVSSEVSITTDSVSTTNSNTVSWSTVTGATSYNVYCTPIIAGYTPGPGNEQIVFSSGSTTFVDTGSPGTIGIPPTTNTAAAGLVEGATGIAVKGTNFASGMTATITQPNGVSVAQTFAYTDTTDGTFNLIMEPGSGSQLAFSDSIYPTYFEVTVSGTTTSGFPVSLVPATGLLFITINSPNPISNQRITAVGDLISGDQLEVAGNSSGTIAAPTGLQINSDGTWQFASGDSVVQFYVRAYDSVAKVWGPWALQSITSITIPSVLGRSRRFIGCRGR